MESNSTDIHTKYQKVASEYSKTRAQVSVLKKAVLDEQAKVGELRDSIKDRDLSIRKYEQEIDSLTFRNHQLAKRVTVLQDELEAANKPKKNKTKSIDGKSSVNLIFNEELGSKIEENARLHQLLSETEQKQREEVDELTRRLDSLNEEAKHHRGALQSVHDQNKVVIDKLQHDKIQLEIRCQTQEKELRELRLKSDECRAKLRDVENDLGTKLKAANRVVHEHVHFNDTLRDELNALNIPSFDRKHRSEVKELIGHVGSLVRDLVTSLSNFHTYIEQRALLCAEVRDERSLKHVHAKLATYLHENAAHLRPIQHSFAAFQRSLEDDCFVKLETAVGLRQFSEKFDGYCAYLSKLLPYYLLSIEDECRWSSCTPTLETKNMQFHSSLSRITAAFNKLNTYVIALAAQSDRSYCHPPSSQQQLLSMLVRSLSDLHNTIKEASVYYNARVSIEHQLPTTTQKLKSTDECVLSSMISLVTFTAKLSSLMKSKHSLMIEGLGFANDDSISTRKTSPAIGRFKQRALNYMTEIQTESPKTVPYHEALCNQQILLSSTESRESLARQLATSQEKMSKLEQAKEHWMLEFQLLQIKHEKDIKKLQKLEEQLRGGGDAISTISSGSSTDEVTLNNGSSPTDTAAALHMGRIKVLNATPALGDNRESEIKSYFTQHIKELIAQMQMADSKATAYHAELISLQRRLHLADANRTQVLDQLAASHSNIDQLKDEMALTSQSYEGQLNMMSEHLANMNDKLTAQKDEIDSLKLKLSTMGSKKQKGK
uniref:Protein phosphatase 1 regulatory subunit 21 n=1 Tax=Strigamia maritima TaxID=126957 RepID=T1JJQ3_STRMM